MINLYDTLLFMYILPKNEQDKRSNKILMLKKDLQITYLIRNY